MGKPSSNLLSMHTKWLGSYDECMKLKPMVNISGTMGTPFLGKYCGTSFKTTKVIPEYVSSSHFSISRLRHSMSESPCEIGMSPDHELNRAQSPSMSDQDLRYRIITCNLHISYEIMVFGIFSRTAFNCQTSYVNYSSLQLIPSGKNSNFCSNIQPRNQNCNIFMRTLFTDSKEGIKQYMNM